jgi:hypothetical protein
MSWTQEQVWTAAAYAHRINGEFVPRGGKFDYETMKTIPSNSSIMKEALGSSTPPFTEEDVELGKKARETVSIDIMTRTLKDSISGFHITISQVLDMAEITTKGSGIGVIACQIKNYFSINKRHEEANNIKPEAGYLAEIGKRVQTNIRVLRVGYSVNYNVFFVNGITDKGQLVMFSFKKALEADSEIAIAGTVKAWTKNDDSFPLTKLSRVKILQNKV